MVDNKKIVGVLALVAFTIAVIPYGLADAFRPPELVQNRFPAWFRAFAADSPWNTPIADHPAIDAFSDLMMARLKNKVHRIEASTRKWTVPIFFINSQRSPKRNVPSIPGLLFEAIDPENTGIAGNVPMPEGIWSDPEADGHMVLVDPVMRLSWEFTRARMGPDGQWTASIIDRWDLDGPGYRKAFTGRNWWRSGATAAGMPLIAGVIRPEAIDAGEIRHALLCATPINRKSAFDGGPRQVCAPPASRTDGQGIGLDFIPEGARIQLDPALDLDTLNLSAGSRVIARAMQRYGMFVGVSAPTFKIFCQNLGPERTVWDSYQNFKDLERIPLGRFHVLVCDYAYQ